VVIESLDVDRKYMIDKGFKANRSRLASLGKH
jgi:hypothetical protein